MQSLSHQFLTFARSKPRDEEYLWCFADRCACGQFQDFAGIPNDARWDLESRFLEETTSHPLTFGALADRLQAALAEKVSV